MNEKQLKQIERFKPMLNKKAEEFLKEEYTEYFNKKIVGYRFYNESPNMFIVFNNLKTQTDFISIACFNNFDDLYIENPYLKESVKNGRK